MFISSMVTPDSPSLATPSTPKPSPATSIQAMNSAATPSPGMPMPTYQSQPCVSTS